MYYPHHSKDLVDVLSAILTPIIAIATSAIAYQQWKTNKDKLRLDLFEKRYGVYNAFRDVLREIMIDGNLSNQSLSKFSINTSDVEFLFKTEIVEYAKIFREKALRLKHVNIQLNDQGLPKGEKREQLAQEDYDLTGWFGDQFDPLKDIFLKYLKFDK